MPLTFPSNLVWLQAAIHIKVFVCHSREGHISILWFLYGGSISDWEITKQSGIIELVKGEMLLVDKGFTVSG